MYNIYLQLVIDHIMRKSTEFKTDYDVTHIKPKIFLLKGKMERVGWRWRKIYNLNFRKNLISSSFVEGFDNVFIKETYIISTKYRQSQPYIGDLIFQSDHNKNCKKQETKSSYNLKSIDNVLNTIIIF